RPDRAAGPGAPPARAAGVPGDHPHVGPGEAGRDHRLVLRRRRRRGSPGGGAGGAGIGLRGGSRRDRRVRRPRAGSRRGEPGGRVHRAAALPRRHVRFGGGGADPLGPAHRATGELGRVPHRGAPPVGRSAAVGRGHRVPRSGRSRRSPRVLPWPLPPSESVRPTYHLTTLGCAKNQVDSEKLEAMLAEAGYARAESVEEADVVMVNTCAFIEEARRESVETILAARDVAKPGARTVVLGCMAQRFGVEVEKALPEVDAVLGLSSYGELVPTLDRLTGWQPVKIRRRPVMDILHQVSRPA